MKVSEAIKKAVDLFNKEGNGDLRGVHVDEVAHGGIFGMAVYMTVEFSRGGDLAASQFDPFIVKVEEENGVIKVEKI